MNSYQNATVMVYSHNVHTVTQHLKTCLFALV